MLHKIRKVRIYGFTLIELVVVVIIIGVIAAFAVPQYKKTIEGTKEKDATATLKLMAAAQRNFYLEKNSYYPIAPTSQTATITSITQINDNLKISVASENDWNYDVVSGTECKDSICNKAVNLTAQRKNSSCKALIAMNTTMSQIPDPVFTGDCIAALSGGNSSGVGDAGGGGSSGGNNDSSGGGTNEGPPGPPGPPAPTPGHGVHCLAIDGCP